MGAVGELNSLLASKRASVVAQTNKRSAEIHEISKRNLFIATKTRKVQGTHLKASVEWRKLREQGSETSMTDWTLFAKESVLNRAMTSLESFAHGWTRHHFTRPITSVTFV